MSKFIFFLVLLSLVCALDSNIDGSLLIKELENKKLNTTTESATNKTLTETFKLLKEIKEKRLNTTTTDKSNDAMSTLEKQAQTIKEKLQKLNTTTTDKSNDSLSTLEKQVQTIKEKLQKLNITTTDKSNDATFEKYAQTIKEKFQKLNTTTTNNGVNNLKNDYKQVLKQVEILKMNLKNNFEKLRKKLSEIVHISKNFAARKYTNASTMLKDVRKSLELQIFVAKNTIGSILFNAKSQIKNISSNAEVLIKDGKLVFKSSGIKVKGLINSVIEANKKNPKETIEAINNILDTVRIQLKKASTELAELKRISSSPFSTQASKVKKMRESLIAFAKQTNGEIGMLYIKMNRHLRIIENNLQQFAAESKQAAKEIKYKVKGVINDDSIANKKETKGGIVNNAVNSFKNVSKIKNLLKK